jgi:acetolactate synthase I/II/III large subunit
MVIASDVIVSFFKEKNITTVFGIIGSANSYIFDSLSKEPTIKVVYTHHEQAAVMAAGSYYRTTGKLAAAVVTAGAGAGNAITGVVSNWADSIPCLVISGQEATKYIDKHSSLRMLGTQGFKAADMVKDIVKFSTTVLDKNHILSSLQKAHYYALEGRPGPTWIDIPFDIQGSQISPSNLSKFIPPNFTYPEYNTADIYKLIEQAERPVILGGHGIKLSYSKEEFESLVNSYQIPILLSWSGIDLLPTSHPYNFGTSGLYGQRCANFVVQNCDLLIVIGSRLALPQTGYNIEAFAPNAKIVIINNDKEELTKYPSRYDVPIYDDCKSFINKLLSFTPPPPKKDWYEKCVSYQKSFPLIEETHKKDDLSYDNSYVLINNLSFLMQEEDILVIGQGTPLPSAHQAFETKKDQIIFASNGLGEMGNGLPSAIGASLGAPNKNIILLDGDGSMMMNLQELQTVVGYKLPIKIIVFNNEGYLFIKHTQKMLFKGNYTGVNKDTGVSLPNFQKIATAFDIPYLNTKTHSLEDFINHQGCCIFECFMNPEQDLIPKVKGVAVVDGILAPPIEEMSPLLSIEQIKNNMISSINPISYKIRK